ncbi:hypothetical protein, partial [Limnospira sp. Paracas R14]|uniref:hypothetical protein n=1 Tax=Limnospira sp. Paracas R14 TaxID=2981108 RepID=UPI0028E15DD1|nr:hypothetical protein [Limnospira sp. Paracas R14]
VTDGTPEGTFMLKDANPGPGNTLFPSMGTRLLDDGRLLIGSLVTDGTIEGTVPYAPEPEPHPVFPMQPALFERDIGDDFYPLEHSNTRIGLNEMTTVFASAGARKLAAENIDGFERVFSGRELWVTNGTENGTRLLVDIVPGPGDGAVTGFIRFGEDR